MGDSKLRKDIISHIRSCINSTKGQITVRQLDADYKMLIGQRIPYEKLGFRSLEEFLESVPTVYITKRSDGTILVGASVSEKTVHIAEMVDRQKSVVRKKPPKFGPFKKGYQKYQHNSYNSHYNSNYNSTNYNNNSHNSQSTWHHNHGPSYNGGAARKSSSSSYQANNRLKSYSHTQFVCSPQTNGSSLSSQKYNINTKKDGYRSPLVPSKIVVPPERNFPPASTPSTSSSPSIPSNPPSPARSTPTPPKTVTFSNVGNTIGNTRGYGEFSLSFGGEKPRNIPSIGADVLINTKRRITRVMDALSLEEKKGDLDSGHSSPTLEYTAITAAATTAAAATAAVAAAAATAAVVEPEFERKGEAIDDLRNFVSIFKLGEVDVTVTETKPKGRCQRAICYCKIKEGPPSESTTEPLRDKNIFLETGFPSRKIGKHLYSSYPNELPDHASATKCAADKALDDLIPKHVKRKTLLISSTDDILTRIPPMLEKYTNAVWMNQIETNYMQKFNEQLPSNWLQVIDSSPFVSIEKCPGGFVLKYCRPGDVLQKGKKLTHNLNVADVAVPCNTVNFNDAHKLTAVISAAKSANEIWCQQIDVPEYDCFAEQFVNMQVFYGKKGNAISPKTISVSSCYAVSQEIHGWVRVRALSEPQENQMVHFFMIDVGEECTVPLKDVFYLRKEFAVDHAQAFVCRLSGLEDFYDMSIGSDYVASLVGTKVVVEMIEDENADPTDPSVLALMQDADSDVSINELVYTQLTLQAATPVLDQDIITEIYVSSIQPSGDVYVQVRSAAYEALLEMLTEIQEIFEKQPANPVPPPPNIQATKDRLYLVKNKQTGELQRVSFLDFAPDNLKAQVYFVDVGNDGVVHFKRDFLYPIDLIDDATARYPPQAVKVRILLKDIPKDFAQMAHRLMPPDQMVLLKVVSRDNEGVPWGEFFKRSTDGGLFCINKSISVEAELAGCSTNIPAVPLSAKPDPLKKKIMFMQFEGVNKNVPSGGFLKKPPLPEKGQFFNVNVPFAVNPWNFFVQPLDTIDELTVIMEQMQDVYNNQRPFTPLCLENIIPGNIYASQHEDGRWYRTSVLKVIHSGSISVFYCDFGYYTNLTLDQLVPLEDRFKELPYQALKAKISGIKPLKDKWTMEDCEIFKDLVTKKQFVSILVDIDKDELYKSDIILDMLLIDTSSEDDIHIRNELVERGIAILVE